MTDRHPNSLANLKPFGPGYDPNRRVTGRPAGASIRDYWNILCEENADGDARYDEPTLRRIAADEKAPHPKRLAAKEILAAHTDGFTPFGKRIGADSVDRISDRTVGKPIAAITVTKIVEPNLLQVQTEIVAIMDARPELRAMIASGRLLSAPAPQESQEIIDTTAEDVPG